jgi:hypothetical protein
MYQENGYQQSGLNQQASGCISGPPSFIQIDGVKYYPAGSVGRQEVGHEARDHEPESLMSDIPLDDYVKKRVRDYVEEQLNRSGNSMDPAESVRRANADISSTVGSRSKSRSAKDVTVW